MPTTLFIPLLPSPLGCSCFARATMPFNIACFGAALPGRFRCFTLRRRPRAQSPIIPCRPVFEFLLVLRPLVAACLALPLRCRAPSPLTPIRSVARVSRCTPPLRWYPNYTTNSLTLHFPFYFFFY